MAPGEGRREVGECRGRGSLRRWGCGGLPQPDERSLSRPCCNEEASVLRSHANIPDSIRDREATVWQGWTAARGSGSATGRQSGGARRSPPLMRASAGSAPVSLPPPPPPARHPGAPLQADSARPGPSLAPPALLHPPWQPPRPPWCAPWGGSVGSSALGARGGLRDRPAAVARAFEQRRRLPLGSPTTRPALLEPAAAMVLAGHQGSCSSLLPVLEGSAANRRSPCPTHTAPQPQCRPPPRAPGTPCPTSWR